MKIVFMGTPDFAVSILEGLIESKHEVLAVVTKEDKPKDRGHEVQMTPVKKLAIEHNIDVLQPAKIKGNEEFMNKLKSYNADVFVVAAYGKILRKDVLDMPKYGCINVHGSLLPKYRGAAPIQWAVIDGEEETGITIMQMDEGMDTGDMLLVKKLKIEESDTAGSIFDKLSQIGKEVIVEALDKIEKGSLTPIKQNEEEATYCKMLSKQDGIIDWNNDTKKIFSFVRGMTPWPSAYTYFNGKMMKVLDLEKLDEEYPNAKCGEVVRVDTKKGIVIKTKDKSLMITKLQMESKSAMLTPDFLRGNKVELGTILGK